MWIVKAKRTEKRKLRRLEQRHCGNTREMIPLFGPFMAGAM